MSCQSGIVLYTVHKVVTRCEFEFQEVAYKCDITLDDAGVPTLKVVYTVHRYLGK